MSFIRPSTEIAPASVVGGKAAALMRMVAKGFDVPAFVVIDPAAFADAATEAAMQTELRQRLAEIGPAPYAARSSAREEDGESASHAGQFLSVLQLSAAELPAAARRVFESGDQQSVASYRQARGLEEPGGAPAVIVQRCVQARCAGVAFSADPVSGRRDRVLVSAVAGLGDRLVGGEVDGQRYLIDRAKGDVLEKPAAQAVLTAADLAALHRLALAVEGAWGSPQDIEWAFEGERLYLLQARPITTRLRPQAVDDETLTVLDNSNIVESYPGLVSPLTFSFAQYAYSRVYRAFVRLAGLPAPVIDSNAAVFDNLLSRVHGRVYYNLGNWYRALSLLPGFAGNRGSMELMMGVSSPLPDELIAGIASAEAKGSTVFARLAIGWRLLREAIRLDRTKASFYERVDAVLSRPASDLELMSATGLAAEYRRIEAILLDRWDAPLVNDFLCMIAFGASRKMMERWAGASGLALHSDVMIGQGDIVSAEPAQRIRAMGQLVAKDENLRNSLAEGRADGLALHPELEAAIAAYLDRFADRCTEELKLESVTLDRDPSPLYRAIAAASMRRAEPQAARDPKVALRQLFAGRPVRRAVAAGALRIARHRVRDRENLRFERTRIFGRARRLFRAIGSQFHALGLLDEPDDIYFLTVPEILGAIEGFATTHDLVGLVKLRRTPGDSDDPGERMLVRGAVSVGSQTRMAKTVATGDDSRERRGLGCSAGTVRAVARVIKDPRSEAIAAGQILVASHTDPGWIAHFTNAAAIVVERGSPLSHSAIVARELGIPCVVALKSAMEWIADGETIEVDGTNGTVRRLS